MNLATQYYENKDYEKSIFWSLKANDIDRKIQTHGFYLPRLNKL